MHQSLVFIVVLCHTINMGLVSYKDKATKDIAFGNNSKEARGVLPISLHGVARRRLAYLSSVESLNDLKIRHGLGLHTLKNRRKGQYAIKINDQYRISFYWTGSDAELVEITDYH